jgi:hypothetical protein
MLLFAGVSLTILLDSDSKGASCGSILDHHHKEPHQLTLNSTQPPLNHDGSGATTDGMVS